MKKELTEKQKKISEILDKWTYWNEINENTIYKTAFNNVCEEIWDKAQHDFAEEIIEEIEDTDFMVKEIETVHKVLTIIRYYVKFKISN